MENYEKKYKDALERAKKIVNDQNASSVWKGWLCNCFPELKESEDDRIRKCICLCLEECVHNDIIRDYEKDKCLAWLEKQGEQKPIDYENATIHQKDFAPNDEEMKELLRTEYEKGRADAITEMQDEQKTADTVEHKFEIGDWVVFKNKHQSIYQVEKIEDGYYILRHTHGGTFRVCVLHNKSLRHWTIQDAKDGDVLCLYYNNRKTFFIFKAIIGEGDYADILVHCCYTGKYQYLEPSFNGECRMHQISDGGYCLPADKEEQDILFQKMKETGYEWDAEKKELKKIEQSIEIPFGAKDSELQEASYYIPEGFHAEIDGNKVVIKKGEQKPVNPSAIKNLERAILAAHPTLEQKYSRSEEDEEMLNVVIKSCEKCGNEYAYSWLKSLKDRIKGE